MQTNPNLILINRLNHDQLSNLQPGDLITIDGESGFSGCKIRFESILGPFVYVAVDAYNNGSFDYKTHYRIADYDFYWMGDKRVGDKGMGDKKPGMESGTVKTGAQLGCGTKTFQEIIKKLESGCSVVEYSYDGSLESFLTIAQLILVLSKDFRVVKFDKRHYVINIKHKNYSVQTNMD